MLALTIDLEGALPVYQQIAAEVRRLIADGSLVRGAELPSVRKLGAALGVNLNTVARAYRQLADEGVITLRPGEAAVVEAVKRSRAAAALDDDKRRALFDVLGRWALEGADRARIEALLAQAVEEFFGTSRPRRGA